MKAISIKQPYASLISENKKIFEIRSWPIKHRGKILICSTKLPFIKDKLCGYALCVCKIEDCRPMSILDAEKAYVTYKKGFFCWVLKDIKLIKPFKIIGQQGLYDINYPNI